MLYSNRFSEHLKHLKSGIKILKKMLKNDKNSLTV